MNGKGKDNQPLTAEQVYKQILKRIVKLQLEPGQLISENQMAGEYGVSRSVIRTAFARLQQMGLIEIYPQRGTYVSQMDLHLIEDILVLRTAVEKEVVYEMFTSLGVEDRKALVKRLEENLVEQEKCSNEQNYFGKFPRLDTEFHKIMIGGVGRYALVDMLGDIMWHLGRWRSFDVMFASRIKELIAEHRAIVEALEQENLALTQERIALHLQTITPIKDQALAQYPSYFKLD